MGVTLWTCVLLCMVLVSWFLRHGLKELGAEPGLLGFWDLDSVGWTCIRYLFLDWDGMGHGLAFGCRFI